MVIYHRFLIIIFLILFLLPNVKAEEDKIFFIDNKGEKIEKPLIYIGESEVRILIKFGNNCSNYRIEGHSTLFLHPLFDMNSEKISIGEGGIYSLDINPNTPYGKYIFLIYMNYTNENNIRVSKQFNLTLEYKRSFELKELKFPKENERTFSITVQTFVDFDKLKLIFDSDGDIETEKEEIVLENITTGNYTFSTKIYKVSTFAGDAQELGYHIIGKIGNRTVEKYEANIPVKITWVSEQQEQTNKNISFGIGIIVILVIAVVVFYYKKFRKKIKVK